MPDLGGLIGELLRLVGEVLGSSSLRLGVGPTLAVVAVLLVLLQLVARPTTRWTSRDPGGLGAAGHAMALAAESGTDVVVSLGTAGIARSTSAFGRMQTFAALDVLDHVGRTAARAGVPVRVTTNDPLTAVAVEVVLDGVHRRTATGERRHRSRAEYQGDGRGVAAGMALARRRAPAAAFGIGGMGEEAVLLASGLVDGAGLATIGTADAAQAPAALLAGGGALIGPQLLEVAADLRADTVARTGVYAADRLLLLLIIVLVAGTALALGGIVDPRAFLVGPA